MKKNEYYKYQISQNFRGVKFSVIRDVVDQFKGAEPPLVQGYFGYLIRNKKKNSQLGIMCWILNLRPANPIFQGH